MKLRLTSGVALTSVIRFLSTAALGTAATTALVREGHRMALYNQIAGDLTAIHGVKEACALEHGVEAGQVGPCSAEVLGRDYLLHGWPAPVLSNEAVKEAGGESVTNAFAPGAIGESPTYLGHDQMWWSKHNSDPILYRPPSEWISGLAAAMNLIGNQDAATDGQGAAAATDEHLKQENDKIFEDLLLQLEKEKKTKKDHSEPSDAHSRRKSTSKG